MIHFWMLFSGIISMWLVWCVGWEMIDDYCEFD